MLPSARISLVLLTSAVFLAGCKSRQGMAPSGPRAAIDPSRVKIFEKHPMSYENYGIVETSQNLKYGEDYSAETMIDALRAKCAAMGCNGLLLEVPEKEMPDVKYFGGYYKGTFYQIPFRLEPQRAVLGRAIYVKD
ncbi:MAG: hypothetical protein ACREJC_22280 [Tepidisphaeraceae bacterium]